MLIRECSGGVVFRGDEVFLLKNEKNEWVLPKGAIRNNELSVDAALRRVRAETGLKSLNVLSTAGETSYEFYSVTRQRPVYNKITWYLMSTDDREFNISNEDGFSDGGFYPIEKALELITYSQDRALVNVSYYKYKSLSKVIA
ncbi:MULTISPECIES: NUDIX hydrolase [Thermoanaerobacterium]|uniref:NUDIX hydrolase n=2 Tax=Thermoanaerobacterium TaxID=28895 RepID=W9E8T8_9THEO|nr:MULTISPECIES: NUDIX hydrolase [Thermoanaerobacterium]AFK86677.1 NUDIX hydrolase [Thermoanaerobacterium saccharolyticum JW/SL-YS485]ETO38308.1 NUDIX hydrolase [Thermoanaerobacterium aotearoense SCUT27]